MPNSDGKPIVVDVSMGAATYGDVLPARRAGGRSSRSAASRRTSRSRSPSGCGLWSSRSSVSGNGAVLLAAKPEVDRFAARCASGRPACDYPETRSGCQVLVLVGPLLQLGVELERAVEDVPRLVEPAGPREMQARW